MRRFIDVKKAEARVSALLAEATTNGAQRNGLRARFRAWILRQPTGPDLIARKEAARLLGVASPNMGRFTDQGRLTPIEVEGSSPVYVREEVEALAEELKAEREEKAGATA